MSARWFVGVVLAALFFIAGFVILYEQYVTFGVFFQLEDVHHEAFAMSAVAMGVGVLIGASVVGSKEK